jgi:hypothetical protein
MEGSAEDHKSKRNALDNDVGVLERAESAAGAISSPSITFFSPQLSFSDPFRNSSSFAEKTCNPSAFSS